MLYTILPIKVNKVNGSFFTNPFWAKIAYIVTLDRSGAVFFVFVGSSHHFHGTFLGKVISLGLLQWDQPADEGVGVTKDSSTLGNPVLVTEARKRSDGGEHLII